MGTEVKDQTVLEMVHISKSFGVVKALDDVSFSVRAGHVHVLVGENGAGKSTLIKVLNGIHTLDRGEIFINGKEIKEHTPKAMLELGVATIHQELSPILDMTIAENIFLGREPMTSARLVNRKKMNSDAAALITQLGFSYKPTTIMRDLTVSDMQIIEIIKAISKNVQILIMDEPTSSITGSEVDVMFEQVRKLKAAGVAVIYITHKMEEVFEIGDDVTVIRDGKTIDSGPLESWNPNKIITSMVGRQIDDVFPVKHAKIGETVLEVKGLCREKVFNDIDFSIRAGEIVGFAGMVGAGRTEVARVLFGMDKGTSGEAFVDGEKLSMKSVYDSIKHGLVMVSEDRKRDGLVLCRSIRENIGLPNLNKYWTGITVSKAKELKDAESMVKVLHIKLNKLSDDALSLSGGNQQKVVLAKWMLQDFKVIIMDEPTRGIDVGAKHEIYGLMCELAEQGAAVMMISSELPELIGMCDRIYVMAGGEIRSELSREEVTQEKIMTLVSIGEAVNE